MTQHELQQVALQRAQQNRSMANYPQIFKGFVEKGIPASDIIPRENVLTFNAWKALGRSVRKGEKGVKVVTWVPAKKDNEQDDEPGGRKICRTTTVFHISQTQPV